MCWKYYNLLNTMQWIWYIWKWIPGKDTIEAVMESVHIAVGDAKADRIYSSLQSIKVCLHQITETMSSFTTYTLGPASRRIKALFSTLGGIRRFKKRFIKCLCSPSCEVRRDRLHWGTSEHCRALGAGCAVGRSRHWWRRGNASCHM